MTKGKSRYIVLKEYKEMDDGNIFAYEVLDYDTKERKFYSYYTASDIYTPHMLHEFNPDTKEGKSLLDNHFIFEDFVKTNTYLLPEILVDSVHDSIELNRMFNQDNNYSSDNIDANASFLAINYLSRIGYFFQGMNCEITDAVYDSLNNSIGFYIDKYTWKYLEDENKKIITDAALHEVGHMEAASKILDEKENVLHLNTGFSNTIFDLEPITCEDGIVYNIKEPRFNKDLCLEHSLEEIANEYKCLVMTKGSYECVYARIGEKFNKILNNNLLKFRYGAGVQDIIEYFKTTYGSSDDEVTELLSAIMEAQNNSSNTKKTNKALMLMSKYEK